MSYLIWKRIIDIVGSSMGLLILAIFFPFVFLAIKLNSSGPAIVKLKRISMGKIIKVYKFRTMVINAAEMKYNLINLNERNDGPFFKIKKDPRITGVGKVLRKFLIDEFPQFMNVLRGELSLVGPRPHEPTEVKKYPEEYKNLTQAKAGITGLSQINGASALPFLKELELDEFYLNNRSFWLDSKIILKTLKILFTDPAGV